MKNITTALILLAALFGLIFIGIHMGRDEPEPIPAPPPSAEGTPVDPPMVTQDNAGEFIYETASSDKHEMRGVWIATVTNIDMPAGMDEAAFRTWAEAACDNIKKKKLNTVIYQVKPTADAFYPSRLAPWSKYVTGKSQGANPGYDPLAIMLESCHQRGLELHAWVNPYRVTMAGESLGDLSAENIATKHPDWVVGYNGQYYLNPGLPEVRQYLLDCVSELVTNYAIDAVHMDDYFYPYPVQGEDFEDSAAFVQYGGAFTELADWRRDNVNTLVAEIYATIKKIKPHVQFGISPFGVWRNIADDDSGSETRAGAMNYDSLYADTRQWIQNGSIDYIAPQIYWSRISKLANFTALIQWWNKELETHASRPVNLYVGLADYKVATTNNDSVWESDSGEINGQIADIRAQENIAGQMHYNYSAITRNALGYFDVVAQDAYEVPALPPPMPWNGAAVPAPCKKAVVTAAASGNQVVISDSGSNDSAHKYAVYRFDASTRDSSDISPDMCDKSSLVGLIYKTGAETTFVDTDIKPGESYRYAVSSISGSGIESTSVVSAQ